MRCTQMVNSMRVMIIGHSATFDYPANLFIWKYLQKALSVSSGDGTDEKVKCASILGKMKLENSN